MGTIPLPLPWYDLHRAGHPPAFTTPDSRKDDCPLCRAEAALSEREPQPLTAQPQADGARRECGSAAPSRSESADHPEPERAAMMARVREITRDLKVGRDPWIVRDLVRERRELHRALGWTP